MWPKCPEVCEPVFIFLAMLIVLGWGGGERGTCLCQDRQENVSIRMLLACSLFSNTPTPTPGGPVCQACYLCYTKKVFLARVLNQVVKAFLMVSVWACQSSHLEPALFLEGRHGNAAASSPTASGSCYPGKGGASATSESSTLFSLRNNKIF